MADEKNSFVVYTGIKETLDDLTDEQVAALFRGMIDYQITGEDPDFSGVLKYIFIPIRQQMDRDNAKWQRKKARRAEAGRQGGIRSGEVRRAKAEAEANEANASQSKQNEANEANEAVNVNGNGNVNVNGNGNVNVNGNGNVNVNMSDGADVFSLSSSLISHLNERTGGKYRPTDQLRDRIRELLEAGYTEEDMIGVIDAKVSEWKDDPKMRSYLRPRTLFGDKFEEYVSGPVPIEVEEERQREEKRAKLLEDRKGIEAALSIISGSIQSIRESPGGVKAHWERYRHLADEKAIAEQQIENINLRLGRLGT